MPLSQDDRNYLLRVQEGQANPQAVHSIDIARKISTLEELQLIIDTYRNNQNSQKLKEVLTDKAIELIKKDSTAPQDFMMVMLQLTNQENARVLNLDLISKECISKLEQKKDFIPSLQKLFKRAAQEQKKSTQPSQAPALDVTTTAIDSLTEITSATQEKFNLLKKLADLYSRHRMATPEADRELTQPLLSAVEREESKSSITPEKRSRLDGLRKRLQEFRDKRKSATVVPIHTGKLSSLQELARNTLALPDGVAVSQSSHPLMTPFEALDSLEKLARDTIALPDGVAVPKHASKLRALQELARNTLALPKGIPTSQQHTHKIRALQELARNTLALPEGIPASPQHASKIRALQELARNTLSLPDGEAINPQHTSPMNPKSTSKRVEALRSLVREHRGKDTDDVTPIEELGTVDLEDGLVTRNHFDKPDDEEAAPDYSNLAAAAMACGRIHPVIDTPSQLSKFVDNIQQRLSKLKKSLTKKLSKKDQTEIRDVEEDIAHMFDTYEKQAMANDRAILPKIRQQMDSIADQFRQLKDSAATKKVAVVDSISRGVAEVGNAFSRLLQSAKSKAKDVAAKVEHKFIKSMLNKEGKLFKPKRCKKFFTSGSGKAFLKQNHLNYQQVYDGPISELKSMDTVGAVRYQDRAMMELKGHHISFPKINEDRQLLPVQQELFELTLRNLSKKSNPPLIKLAGNISSRLLENVFADPKTAPHIIVDTTLIRPALSPRCSSIVETHNNRLIAQHQPAAKHEQSEQPVFFSRKPDQHQAPELTPPPRRPAIK